MTPWQGILPAVVTPVDEEGKFNVRAFDRLSERLYGAGIDGLYVCGQTGEGYQQPSAQRKAVAEAAVRNSPLGKTVIVHVGARSNAEAIELARHASEIGASAVSSLPPVGNPTFEEVQAYYSELAAASGVPLLVYYFPSLAQSIVHLDHFLRLCAIPNVIGLKFTHSDLYRLSRIKQAGSVVFMGSDEILAPGLLMGADGGIGAFYNAIPELFVDLYRQARAGAWEETRTLQTTINELIAIGLRFPVLAAVKAMVSWSGVDCGPPIAPNRRLTREEDGELRGLLDRSRFAGRAINPA